jgi:hypothetical protein
LCVSLATILKQENPLAGQEVVKRNTWRTLDVPSIPERMVAPVALPATTITDTPKKMKALGHVYRQVCRENSIQCP